MGLRTVGALSRGVSWPSRCPERNSGEGAGGEVRGQAGGREDGAGQACSIQEALGPHPSHCPFAPLSLYFLFGKMGPELLPRRDAVGTGHRHSSATERALNSVIRKEASGLGRQLTAPPGSGLYLILCSAGAGSGVQPTSSLIPKGNPPSPASFPGCVIADKSLNLSELLAPPFATKSRLSQGPEGGVPPWKD